MDLDAASAEAQARELGSISEARGYRADVRDLASLEDAMRAAARDFGGIDVVIANAGVDVLESMAGGDPAQFERVIDINLNGVWRTFHAAAPYVVESRGHLLATSSMAAFIHSPLQGAYSASKAGVWALCNAVRLELRHRGVSVGSVHPTFFATPMVESFHADPAGRALWGENKKPPFQLVDRAEVVRETCDAIERRAEIVTVPRSLAYVARAPGLVRRIVERIGFSEAVVTKALALARR